MIIPKYETFLCIKLIWFYKNNGATLTPSIFFSETFTDYKDGIILGGGGMELVLLIGIQPSRHLLRHLPSLLTSRLSYSSVL